MSDNQVGIITFSSVPVFYSLNIRIISVLDQFYSYYFYHLIMLTDEQ